MQRNKARVHVCARMRVRARLESSECRCTCGVRACEEGEGRGGEWGGELALNEGEAN